MSFPKRGAPFVKEQRKLSVAVVATIGSMLRLEWGPGQNKHALYGDLATMSPTVLSKSESVNKNTMIVTPLAICWFNKKCGFLKV